MRYLILLVLVCVSQYTQACDTVTIAGNSYWEPYITNPALPEGSAVLVIKKIFAELDLPVTYIDVDNPRHLKHALQFGDIDLYLNTYDNPYMATLLKLSTAPLAQDSLTVMVKTDQVTEVVRWEDLIGQRGLMVKNFQLPADFEDFKNRYLYIQGEGNMTDLVAKLSSNEADYILGSQKQLEYAKEHIPTEELTVHPTLKVSSQVLVGFSKKSSCVEYYSYVNKRLQQGAGT